MPESLPQVPGYETGLLYAPALGEPTGGDLYGVWQLPSGEVAVLVGDVAGKGVETAALSAMVRFFVEARSWDAESPARVLEQTNAMLTGRLPSDTFVTAFLAVLGARLAALGERRAPAAAAPVRRRGARAGGHRPAARAWTRAARYGERELELADGDLVFAYTDGLVEARRGEEAYGAERLAGSVCEPGRRRWRRSSWRSAVHDEVAAWAAGWATTPWRWRCGGAEPRRRSPPAAHSA